MVVVDFADLECEASANQLLFAQGVNSNKRAAGSAACIEKGPPPGNGSPFSFYTSSYSPVQPMLCKIVKDANERIT
ncbi:hypothetical protein DXB03_14380 [Lachnospiraceae bacterium OF11-28]|nr:hypothetical protein DXB03_14380 [Lachnospiraceae bacterium OF11-28]